MGQINCPTANRHTTRPIWGLLFCWPLIGTAQNIGSQAPPSAPPKAYTQALQAIEAADPERAATLLQQVVEQHPEWAGAWIDLALLAMRQSQYAQAEEFLIALEERFTPLPPAISQTVNRMRGQIRQHIAAQIQEQNTAISNVRQNTLLLATGHETNANAGLSFNALTLNLPEGDATVNIDPSSQARKAQTLRVGLVHYGQQALERGNLTWQIQVQTRQYTLTSLNNTELLAQTTLEQPTLPGQITMGWQNIWLGGHTIYQTPLIRWQHDIPWAGACDWQQHIQAEARKHPRASHLNTHWQAYRATWRCQPGQQRLQLYVQAARENAANNTRPGGNSLHKQWGLQHEWINPFGLQDHSLLTRLDILHTRDSATYSPLLDNGRPRRLQRIDGLLSWTAPLPQQAPWRWSISLQKNSQHSNIPLFKQKNTALETSLWRTW